MYPNNYLNLFPPFPRNNTVFVAMSFADQFDYRWKNVIEPAISSLHVNGIALNAERVDARTIGDSILTEILMHIGNARLIFADITTIGHLNSHAIRNGNVMYEVGIAHAVRLPEEVVLFRSDTDPLLFDVTNVRVNTYAPDDDPENARQTVINAITEALREIDLKQHLAVMSAAHSLDAYAWWALATALQSSGVTMQPGQNIAQALTNAPHNQAITRLLQIGALATEYPVLSAELLQAKGQEPIEELITYKITAFGKAIMEFTYTKMQMLDPDVQKAIESSLTEGPT
jgi:hypothetical protein